MLIWPLLCTVLITLVLAYGAFFYGGEFPENWNICLLGIAGISMVDWVGTRNHQRAPKIEPWLSCQAIMLPLYIAFELTPISVGLLQFLSLVRGELLR